MKSFRTLITISLLLGILLSACQPAVVPTQPDQDKYPSEDGKVNETTQDPGNLYPADTSEGVFGNQAYITNPSASEEELDKIANANNQFAIELYKQLTDEAGNLIYSPFSIYQALLMTYAGAEGETAESMMQALGIKDNKEVHNVMNALNQLLHAAPESAEGKVDPLIFNIANALWMQKDFQFEQAFLDKLSANYAAGIKLVDYNNPEEVRDLINTWVALQTNDKITDLIPEGMLNEMTRMVLTNAVYFKGAWRNQFDPAVTEQGVFNALDGSKIDVEMMYNSFRGGAAVDEKMTIVSLPYDTGKFAMAIVMPNDFEAYQKEFNVGALNNIFATLNETSPQVNLYMPKFKAESAIDLAEKLQGMGLADAFDASKADFSGMTGNKDLYISDVIHQAYIDVNEEGTEAAAATAIGMSVTSLPTDELTIKLDKPFIYVIYNTETNTVLFMGHVVAP